MADAEACEAPKGRDDWKRRQGLGARYLAEIDKIAQAQKEIEHRETVKECARNRAESLRKEIAGLVTEEDPLRILETTDPARVLVVQREDREVTIEVMPVVHVERP